MSPTVLIDYGCHSFTHRLATRLGELGLPIRYLVNGSLESPNLTSLESWIKAKPKIVRSVESKRPYGKLSLRRRLQGEIEWAGECVRVLEEERPSAVIVSTVPLAAVARIQRWTESRHIPLIYWLQDLQGRAIHDLLGSKLGLPGRVLGSLAQIFEQDVIEKSRMVITIAPGHENELPPLVRKNNRFALLENWANIEEFPQFPQVNEWSVRNGLDQTQNVVYSGTLGLKHDLATFLSLARSLRNRSDVRVVVVSSGHAADSLRIRAQSSGLSNLLILPFQPHTEVPQVLASAAVLIAPLDASAGTFCVPSKVLSYFCAARPTVIAIDPANPAASTIQKNSLGAVVPPGDAGAFYEAVANLLNDRAEREATGRRARAYDERTFGLDSVTSRFLKIISSSNISCGFDTAPFVAPKTHSAANTY